MEFMSCDSVQPLSYFLSIMQIYKTSIKTHSVGQHGVIAPSRIFGQHDAVKPSPNFSPGDNVDVGARPAHPLPNF